MRIQEQDIIGGVPAFFVQDTLRPIYNYNSRMDNDIVMPVKSRTELSNKLSAEGYIEWVNPGYWMTTLGKEWVEDGFKLTVKGNVFVAASREEPLSRAEADVLYDRFLKEIDVYNASDQDHIISSVLLFGSYLSDCPEVNDIDFGVKIVPKGYYKDMLENIEKIFVPEDKQLDRFEIVAKHFHTISKRYSIHHYREVVHLKMTNKNLQYKRVYLSDSDDSRMADLASFYRQKIKHSRD